MRNQKALNRGKGRRGGRFHQQSMGRRAGVVAQEVRRVVFNPLLLPPPLPGTHIE